jgi:hypothetical protein
MMEQIVVILVFAICSAVCVSIFVESYLMEHRTIEEKHAVHAAGSGAEAYKALGGDAGGAALVIGGAKENTASSGRGSVVFYNSQWKPCGEDEASYILRITQLDDPDGLLMPAEVTVSKIDGENLFTLPVSANMLSSSQAQVNRALTHSSSGEGTGDE